MGEISKSLKLSIPMTVEGSRANVFTLFPWFSRSLSMYMEFQVDMGEYLIADAIRFWIHNSISNLYLRELCEEPWQQSIMDGIIRVHLFLKITLACVNVS